MTLPTVQSIAIPGLETAPEFERIVAVEPGPGSSMLIYRRTSDGRTKVERQESYPWVVTTPRASALARLTQSEIELDGPGELRIFKRFSSPTLWRDALRELRNNGADYLIFLSRTEQFLAESGLGLFHNLEFEELRRAQVDIETLGLNPEDPDNQIIIVTATLNGSDPLIVHAGEQDESGMIEALNDWIQSNNPDVIEGHNIFNFDIPFLISRAAQHGMELRWGRNGSPLRPGRRQRFKAGARTIPYDAAYVHGRHIIDTYQQIQRYDVAGHLSSYALKPAIRELGLERHNRTHVEGNDISEVWRTDPDRLLRYALDDVLDTNVLSELTLPTEYYQSRLLPASLQAVATGGPGEKVNDLLVRAYLRAGQSIPLPGRPADYPGGFTAVRATGVFGPPVVNADVESLYPSIMLADEIAPKSDVLGVFVPLLRALTTERLRAKRIASESEGADGARWTGTQASLKVLINSFYGYLGYGRGYFNDFEAAGRVTRRGHQVIQSVERQLTAQNCTIIEIDTDGIYFVPPSEFGTPEAIEKLINQVNSVAEESIRLTVDGIWNKMLSLRLKNYALLASGGQLTVKGSSLRSRRDEPYLRAFLTNAIRGYLDPHHHLGPRDLYLNIAQRILAGDFTPEEIARQESITERTFSSVSNARLARAARGERIGERITVYQRRDGELERLEHYANDEDRAYLLDRLRAMAERFRPLYPDDGTFSYTYPLISTSSDINMLREQERATQQSLFDL